MLSGHILRLCDIAFERNLGRDLYSCVVCAFLHGHEWMDKPHSHGVA